MAVTMKNGVFRDDRSRYLFIQAVSQLSSRG
jgi:hypothetical protein